MKFEQKHPDAKSIDKFDFQDSYIIKDSGLGQCVVCDSFTRWIDGRAQKSVCSEECCSSFWSANKGKTNYRHQQPDLVRQSCELELALASIAEPAWKDIIIVVHDQLMYLKMCIESIREHTSNYTLYIWDNGSGKETVDYLEQLQKEFAIGKDLDWDIEVWRSEKNEGFIIPNNKMAAIGEGDYIILLNSDTKVFRNWDMAMIGWLQQNSNVAQVGYWGGHLGDDGRGSGGDFGYNVDYIYGLCFCISRETYSKYGLFDQENLDFAYCEDSDFSLRLLEDGKNLYALHAPLVYHYQNKTIQAVNEEGRIDVRATFEHNHEYIRLRWKDYLSTKRVLLNRKE
jgi:GT2 family glycosyltransferase